MRFYLGLINFMPLHYIYILRERTDDRKAEADDKRRFRQRENEQ